jgi:hypothetical protein
MTPLTMSMPLLGSGNLCQRQPNLVGIASVTHQQKEMNQFNWAIISN